MTLTNMKTHFDFKSFGARDAILCHDEQELSVLLEELFKADIRWCSGKDALYIPPPAHDELAHGNPILLYPNYEPSVWRGSKSMVWGSDIDNAENVIDFDELIFDSGMITISIDELL